MEDAERAVELLAVSRQNEAALRAALEVASSRAARAEAAAAAAQTHLAATQTAVVNEAARLRSCRALLEFLHSDEATSGGAKGRILRLLTELAARDGWQAGVLCAHSVAPHGALQGHGSRPSAALSG